MFAMFNQLAGGEPVGAERLPWRTWPRPRLAQVAFLATLAAIVALCVVLSTQVHAVMRPCLTSASGPASSAASPPSKPVPSLPPRRRSPGGPSGRRAPSSRRCAA